MTSCIGAGDTIGPCSTFNSTTARTQGRWPERSPMDRALRTPERVPHERQDPLDLERLEAHPRVVLAPGGSDRHLDQRRDGLSAHPQEPARLTPADRRWR